MLGVCGSMLITSRSSWASRVFLQQSARDCQKSRMASGPMNSAAPEATPGIGDMRSLVLRAWLEPGITSQLRARIVEIAPGRSERPMLVTTSVDEVCRVVRNWLETLQDRGTDGDGDGTVTAR